MGLLIGLAACAREGPEAKIRRTLDEAVTALGSRDAKAAGAVMSDDFVDDAKRGKKDLVRLAFFALQRGPVLIALQSVETKVNGTTATSEVKALAVQGSPTITRAADLLPTNARSFDVTLTWRKDGDDWLITHASGLPDVALD